MQKQQGKIQRQQAEEHRLLRKQLPRQAEINVALEAKVAAKSGTSDSEGVAKTAEQLLERKRKLAYVPEASVNPFPPRPATLTTRMPQLYDLHGNKTYDALSKQEVYLFNEDGGLSYGGLQKRFQALTNSVHGVYAMLCNRWTMLELRGQLEQEPGSSQRKGADALRANLQFVEDRVYQAADGVVADESVYLAVPAARLYLRELYFVLAEKRSWGAKVEISRAARVDLEWWASLPGENNWVNPPWALLDEVAHKVREEGAAATVVAPYWPVGKVTVGSRIEVFWKDDACFCPGVVKEFSEDGKAHVLYDDGDEETLDLSEENFKIICSSGVSELTDETADVNSESIDCGADYKENKRGGAVENFLTRRKDAGTTG
eukprot:gene13110-biopygen13502